MKSITLVLLAAVAASAADFYTGQAARLVIGQQTFTEAAQGAGQNLLGGVGGVAYAANTLFVADGNRIGASPVNQRVLIFKNLSGNLPQPTDELLYTTRCPVCIGGADVVLGQPDFSTTNIAVTQSGMRTPTAVASDGRVLAVADSDNNRVLIWNSIPTSNGAPADVVVGQPNFTSNSIPGNIPNAKSMRGPSGLWIQNGKLYVADTQNHRILIFNSIPTANGAAADLVLGQPNLTTFVEPDLTKANTGATASNLESPVSVTSDGIRLFVSDLGHNRVMIWNTIPTANNAPADVIVGQPDVNTAFSNNATLCPASSSGTVSTSGTAVTWLSGDQFLTERSGSAISINGTAYGVNSVTNPTALVLTTSAGTNSSVPYATYSNQCNATLDFPRYALSDGTRLFIADGGNDRVLVFNRIPTSNGAAADVIIGELGGEINQASDSTDSMRTPLSLAWDGTNLYVADSFNVRVMVYTPAAHNVPYSGVRNAASLNVYAVGKVNVTGTITANDTVTVTINGTDYKYTVVKTDTFDAIVTALATMINAANSKLGDPNVFAIANHATGDLLLTAKKAGTDGNTVTLATTLSTSATLVATTSGATLAGGGDAASIAPGTLVAVLGDNLSDVTLSAPRNAPLLPTMLGNTQVYMDGVQTPLVSVSPTQIVAQAPFEFLDRTSSSVYVRTVHSDGTITVTTPIAMTIVPQNPGIFADPGPDPRNAVMMHGSTQASGTVSVDGSVKAGDTGTVTIEDRSYTYTVLATDTLATVRDGLIALINQDPKVEAFAAVSFTRIRLRARVPGPDGNGIPFSASNGAGAQLIMTALTSSLCCANTGRVTLDNPAAPGETVTIMATGLGLSHQLTENTGIPYSGPPTEPDAFVSSLAGGKTANVLAATMMPGAVGVYEVQLELNSSMPTDPLTQLTIAQDVFVSNIVTFPLVNSNPPSSP
jgi:phage tail sheath gpL-like